MGPARLIRKLLLIVQGRNSQSLSYSAKAGSVRDITKESRGSAWYLNMESKISVKKS